MSLLRTLINNGKVFGAKNGEIKSAPFRNFSVDPKLLKHYAKGLIGTSGLGAPKILSGVKATGAALNFDFSTLGVAVGGIGVEIKVNTPRDSAPQTITCSYVVVPAVITHTVSFEPSAMENARFALLSAYALSNEVFPVPQNLPQVNFADGNIPNGSAVTVKIYDLADDETIEFVKSLAEIEK